MRDHTLGWVQNSSNFENLRNFVEAFVPNSKRWNYIMKTLSETDIVRDPDVRQSLKTALNQSVVKLNFSQLVGTRSPQNDKNSCNAIGQIAVAGQRRPFVDDWSAACFLRWAECLGFVKTDMEAYWFKLTDRGRLFASDFVVSNLNDNEALVQGLMEYPPVSRILKYLKENNSRAVSKFELGQNLGFSGEDGFTSMGQSTLSYLRRVDNMKDRKKLLTDVEGSSDKYARMICSWLSCLGWVKQEPFSLENKNFKDPIKCPWFYRIEFRGENILRRIDGVSIHPSVEKYVSWNMLATKAKNKVFLRNRRAMLLNILKSKKSSITEDYIISEMEKKGFPDYIYELPVDFIGLVNCGIEIETSGVSKKNYFLRSKIKGLIIPQQKNITYLEDAKLEKLKHEIRRKTPNIDPRYVELIEISRSKSLAKIFEVQVADLLQKEYGLETTLLGGGWAPDSLAFVEDAGCSYGVIIDTKAYKDGFSLPVSEQDKMIRYIEDNKNRPTQSQGNKFWWRNFPEKIEDFKFLFVSSKFSNSSIQKGLEYIFSRTQVHGAVLNAEQILYGAELIKTKKINLEEFGGFFKEKEIYFE
ncbi:hypothetical protein NKW45_10995 [Acetobacter orientalis]|uniref:restriction endonuclease FokI C-terminal domain-containing protein n=1 Tax=Acetobacter orientalis TaxID=146474 RepID=UPI0020A25001|nr:restriction endonuclease FokI C-terminal domain-containing protein [Acetobacter orientalis]MCP1222369.1 hypothetical protein [Acetobacter orientalis]